jgi:hypothetical protein
MRPIDRPRPAFSLATGCGKYRVVAHEDGRATALRHGEPWLNLVSRPILELARHLHALRGALGAAGLDPMAQGEVPATYGENGDLLRIGTPDGLVVVQSAQGRVSVTRDGEPVEIFKGDNLMLALAHEIEGAEAAIREAGLDDTPSPAP